MAVKKNSKKELPNTGTQINIPSLQSIYKFLSLTMTKVGTVGFFVITLTVYIFVFVPQEIKNELTNTWLLFKCADCQFGYIYLILVLITVLIFNVVFNKKAHKLKDERIKEISKEKTDIQELVIGKKLDTSKETP